MKLPEKCRVCPRKCNVNRLKNEEGFCRTGYFSRVYSFFAHHGEESVLSGTQGSGVIFFSMCNMSCVFCQNHKFSQKKSGREVSFDELADMMLALQEQGCHNINLVSPSHNIPQIINSILIAKKKGLVLPIVYNSNGYDSVSSLKLLEGMVDIYLPDIKYADNKMSEKYSNTADYVEVSQLAVLEMARQVGNLVIKDGLAKKGIIIRHLVMSHNISGADKVLKFISEKISKHTYISLMNQYYPCYKAHNFPEISKRISLEEYEDACNLLFKYELYNGWIQEEPCDEIKDKFIGENL